MPKQINELPPASAVADTDLTNIKQGSDDRYATIAQILDNIGTAIFRAVAKATPIDADTIAFSDSASSNVIKKVTWANLKSVAKTAFEAVVFTWALRQIFTTGISLPASNGVQFNGGNVATSMDFDAAEVTSANAIVRFLRNTTTSGARQFIVYAGDGTATEVLTLNAATGLLQILGNTVWHAGNDGSGSGLDADLLDGANTGAATGNIPVLEDVGGTPGLPAVDGSQLLNIPDFDENVKATGTDTTPGALADKLVGSDSITLTLLNSGGDESLQLDVAFTDEPRNHLLARATSDGQTVISFGDAIVDDASGGGQGLVKQHLIYKNGQLLINTQFNDEISPDTGDYAVTNAATGEITLQAGEEASTGDIFTYLAIAKTTIS